MCSFNTIVLAQYKTFVGGITFNITNIEQNNFAYKLGYAKTKQNSQGLYYFIYHIDIGYCKPNEISYIIPSFTYNFINYFTKKNPKSFSLGARLSDFAFNNNNDVRIAPVLQCTFFGNQMNINYSYNFPASNKNFEGMFGRHAVGIYFTLCPFSKKESSAPMK